MRREEKQKELTEVKSAQKRGSFIKTAAIILIIAGLGFGIFKFFTAAPSTGSSSVDVLKTCVNHTGGASMHIHPRLSIKKNGVEEEIPKDIGVSLFCMKPIHTHDDSGTLHVEFPRQNDFTLGDFFTIWEKPFPKSTTFLMTQDGIVNTEFENLILRDGALIEISYEEAK